MNQQTAEAANRIIQSLRRKFWLEPTASQRTQERKPWAVHLRLRILEPGATHAVRETEVVTHDLSTGGFSFLTRYYVHGDASVEATFDTVPQRPTIVGVVRNCIHLSGAMHRVGVQFTEVRRAGADQAPGKASASTGAQS